MSLVFGILFTAFAATISHAAPNKDCVREDIRSVSLPIFPDQAGSETFEYRFQMRAKNADASTPTIIMLPGGPGGTSMNLLPENPYFDFLELSLGLPNSYRVILTDPRGRGCNHDLAKELPDAAYKSSHLAADVLAMIRHLGLKNYILYGHSYGSLLATQVAARAARGEAHPPRAVVMSGILGKAFRTNEQEDAFELEWALVRGQLPPGLVSKFPITLAEFPRATSLPLGRGGQVWSNFIQNKLSEGAAFLNGKLISPDLAATLLKLESADPSELEKLRAEVDEAGAGYGDLLNHPIFVQIACRELFSEGNDGTEACRQQNIPHDDPFDSSEWQISAPIFYVQGENDPNTPPAQAIYHFSRQRNPQRFLVHVPKAGHGSMGAITECKDAFWQSVLAGGQSLQLALNACSVKPRVQRP